ncbi:hypothetical protein LTR95_012722 [Oleoguttula sp. CCFEE 5521]
MEPTLKIAKSGESDIVKITAGDVAASIGSSNRSASEDLLEATSSLVQLVTLANRSGLEGLKMPRKARDWDADAVELYPKQGLLSDVKIKSGTKEITAHRYVLSRNSAYFRGLFAKEWKETSREVIELFDENANAVEAMLRHLYEKRYLHFEYRENELGRQVNEH